ncbi:MAG: hypothetical protein WCC99_15150 [Candidatus Sulfotelmatobacter sp.]
MSRKIGISAEQIANLHSYPADPNFSGLERLVLAFADGMTRTPVEVPDSLFARLRDQFSDAQLVELTACIAWENYRARFDHAFGIESEDFSAGDYCALPVTSSGGARGPVS